MRGRVSGEPSSQVRAVPPPPAAAPPAAPPPPAAAASPPSTGAPPPRRAAGAGFDRVERRHRVGGGRRRRQRRYSAAPPCRPGGAGCSRDWTWSARFEDREGTRKPCKPSARKCDFCPSSRLARGDEAAGARSPVEAVNFCEGRRGRCRRACGSLVIAALASIAMASRTVVRGGSATQTVRPPRGLRLQAEQGGPLLRDASCSCIRRARAVRPTAGAAGGAAWRRRRATAASRR